MTIEMILFAALCLLNSISIILITWIVILSVRERRDDKWSNTEW